MIRGDDQEGGPIAIELVDLADQTGEQLVDTRHHRRVVLPDRAHVLQGEWGLLERRGEERAAIVRVVGVHEEEPRMAPESPQPLARPPKHLRPVEMLGRARRRSGALGRGVLEEPIEARVEAEEPPDVAATSKPGRQIPGRTQRLCDRWKRLWDRDLRGKPSRQERPVGWESPGRG